MASSASVQSAGWQYGRRYAGAPVEFYSDVQIALRQRFPDITVVVLDICNGFLNYLPREADYARDTYPVRIALFARGSMERARDKAADLIAALF